MAGDMFDTAKFPPSQAALRRIRADLAQIFRDPPPGIFVAVNDANVAWVDALVTGPTDTPYEGGFFWFRMQFPADYPNRPPRVTLMTTGGGQVRFNPNLYRDGKVCLSLLGTWEGPGWSPAQSCASILVSIQSLMSAEPYRNEPGYENTTSTRDIALYNECIVHETIRVAVCDTLEETDYAKSMPPALRELAREVAPNFMEFFKEKCRERMGKDKQRMVDSFREDRGTFQWSQLLQRLERLQAALPTPDPESASEGNGEEDDEDNDDAVSQADAEDVKPVLTPSLSPGV